jgi:hypothetical protein
LFLAVNAIRAIFSTLLVLVFPLLPKPELAFRPPQCAAERVRDAVAEVFLGRVGVDLGDVGGGRGGV